MASSFRKATLLPTGTTSTRGTKVFPRWLIVLPCAGVGRGVSPFARLSKMTAPPGPSAPPPDTVPLTVTVGFTGRAGGEASVGAAPAEAGDGDDDVPGSAAAAG